MPLWIYKVLSGQACTKSRGEIMASAVDNYLGEALGQLYVKIFPRKRKKNMLDLVNNVQKAIRIDSWVDDATVQKKSKKNYLPRLRK
jgi:putative endopeptidase